MAKNAEKEKPAVESELESVGGEEEEDEIQMRLFEDEDEEEEKRLSDACDEEESDGELKQTSTAKSEVINRIGEKLFGGRKDWMKMTVEEIELYSRQLELMSAQIKLVISSMRADHH